MLAQVVRAIGVRAVRPRLQKDGCAATLPQQRDHLFRQNLDGGSSRRCSRGRLGIIIHHDVVPMAREQRRDVRRALVDLAKFGVHAVALG